MTGWEFAKYLTDTAYDHWCITSLFLFLAASFTPVSVKMEGHNSHKKNEER